MNDHFVLNSQYVKFSMVMEVSHLIRIHSELCNFVTLIPVSRVMLLQKLETCECCPTAAPQLVEKQRYDRNPDWLARNTRILFLLGGLKIISNLQIFHLVFKLQRYCCCSGFCLAAAILSIFQHSQIQQKLKCYSLNLQSSTDGDSLSKLLCAGQTHIHHTVILMTGLGADYCNHSCHIIHVM